MYGAYRVEQVDRHGAGGLVWTAGQVNPKWIGWGRCTGLDKLGQVNWGRLAGAGTMW